MLRVKIFFGGEGPIRINLFMALQDLQLNVIDTYQASADLHPNP